MFILFMSASRTTSLKKLATYHRKQHKTNTTTKAFAQYPRLIVTRSSKHISAQIISLTWESILQCKDFTLQWTKSERAFTIGKKIATLALEKNVTQVVFDRNGFYYHGRIARLADGAREWWLLF